VLDRKSVPFALSFPTGRSDFDHLQLEVTGYGCLDHFLEGDTYREFSAQ